MTVITNFLKKDIEKRIRTQRKFSKKNSCTKLF